MYSPWGEVQHTKPITNGVAFVTTAGHGGMRVSKGFAKKHLSEAAVKRGMAYGSYLFYEEDCDWAIPAFELEEHYDKFYKEDSRMQLLKTLSLWNLDYLEERNIEPTEEEANIYRLNKKRDKMRNEKDPDFIVAASQTEDPNVIKVWTADNIEHFVETDSYQYQLHDLNLLSYCKVISSLTK